MDSMAGKNLVFFIFYFLVFLYRFLKFFISFLGVNLQMPDSKL